MDTHEHKHFHKLLMAYLWYQAINDQAMPSLIFKRHYLNFEITRLIQQGK
jgi:hypothetical protein